MRTLILIIFIICQDFIKASLTSNETFESLKKISSYDPDSEKIYIFCILDNQSSSYVFNKTTNEVEFININSGILTKGRFENPLCKDIIEIILQDNEFFVDLPKDDKNIMKRGKDGLLIRFIHKNRELTLWSPIYLSVMGASNKEDALKKDLTNHIRVILKLSFSFPYLVDPFYLEELDLDGKPHANNETIKAAIQKQAKTPPLE